MAEDWEFVCPRPRSSRACDPCRSRKIRCIPSEKTSGTDACRRCAKLGYTCTVSGSLQSTTTGQAPRSHEMRAKSDRSSNGNDFVANLFNEKPKEEDESARLCEMHRTVFQGQIGGEGKPCALKDTTPSVGGSVICESGSGKINLNMQDAEELLCQFRERQEFFPFIELPEGTSAASMAASRPFLLLAILTVSLTRKPLLQRRVDERFRRVLSERIIFYGEKSLDYVQGLLVYMAWCPLHIRPLSSQLSQFMQILITMISDLKLTENLHDGAARDACLGCYILSSLLSLGFRRRGDDAAYSYLKAAVDASMTLAQPYDRKLQFAKLQLLFEETVRSQAEYGSERCPITKKQRVQERIESIRLELQIFERVHGLSNISLHVFALYLKVNIALLPFRTLDAKPSHTPDSESLLDDATSCVSEIRAFFEYFLSIPVDQYILLSKREWCLLILTISASSQICFLSPAVSSPEWTHFQTKTRSSILIYLESLSHRMSSLSVSKPGETPDVFFMFKSVLDIVLPTYAPPTCSSSSSSSYSIERLSPVSQDDNQEVTALPSPSTRCPMMNGSIRKSEFWHSMEQSDLYLAEFGTGGDAEGVCTVGVPGVHSLFDDSGDWPSIFSEWVNIATN
ncbi:Zn(II)2Cys6 transcription factor domain-containing protein [Aspergillus ibericus CBS 121593]|uniref:Zn(2)-C6 fungal-type domain-containing protein n=1 Tax=Aspergillus ibericus CBS 121593 TaxID=1448316 RepID=A0A395GT90_9EURO|nr:hypothetical protein BO80DRAFT_495306 [Aspergillus ibericus CBS 121593]RAK98745.1 hypothetical protein BO80DRAFT_495306 [Aspergillus ibericus CBS 121593]